MSGVAAVRLDGAVPVRSAVFRLVGAQRAVRPGPGTSFTVFSAAGGGDTLLVVVVAPVGHTLGEGALVSVQVPDVRRLAQYRLTLLQVASADYALHNPADFALRFTPAR